MVMTRLPRLRSLLMKARLSRVRNCVHSSCQRNGTRFFFCSRRGSGNGATGSLRKRNLLNILDQPKRFIFVPPKFRCITPRRHQLSAIVLLVNNVATQIAQRRFQNIENKFRPGRSTRCAGPQIGAELVLVFCFREITQHLRRRPEKDQPPALVEQDGFVKHLEKFRARLVNGDDDDFVVRHRTNDFDDVLGIF